MWSLDPNPLLIICITVTLFIGLLLGILTTARLKNKSIKEELEKAKTIKEEYGKKEFERGCITTRLTHEQAYSTVINAVILDEGSEFNLKNTEVAVIPRILRAIQKVIKELENPST